MLIDDEANMAQDVAAISSEYPFRDEFPTNILPVY